MKTPFHLRDRWWHHGCVTSSGQCRIQIGPLGTASKDLHVRRRRLLSLTGQTARQRHAIHDLEYNFMIISKNKNVMKSEQDLAIRGPRQTIQSIVTIGPGTLPNHHSQTCRMYGKDPCGTHGTPEPVLLGPKPPHTGTRIHRPQTADYRPQTTATDCTYDPSVYSRHRQP